MDEQLRLKCLELALSANRGEPVAEAERYFEFVTARASKAGGYAPPVDAGGDVAVVASGELVKVWSANNAGWSS